MQNQYGTKERDLENMKEKATDYASSAIRQGEEKVKKMTSDVENKLKEGQEQLKKIASTVDKQIRENPWPIVTGIAAACLFLGFILGTTRRGE